MLKTKISVAVTAALLLSAGTASASTTITGWNLDNVSVSTTSPTAAGTSTIYDRTATNPGALTTGTITFDGKSGFSPGVKIVNDDALTGSNGFNCIMANATGSSCNAEKQTHKRFKLQSTGSGPTDMVFNVNPNGSFTTPGNDGLYKVFQAFGNNTGARMDSFQVTLGTGVGAAFATSAANDGLSFVQSFDPKKPLNNSQFSALFSDGLFGHIDEFHPLEGYFSKDRTGFNLAFDGADSFHSTGMFGDYTSLFGSMLSYDQLPLGYFFDDDGNASTDDVLIAHQLADGSWVQNRSVDVAGNIATIAFGNGGTAYATLGDLVTALTDTGIQQCSAAATTGAPCLAGTTEIDDLAKFNLSFYIDPTGYAGEQFTMRYEVAAVPEAETWGMMLAGLGLVGFAVRRRRI